MRVLVFDTETTGLPSSKVISPDTLNLWPNIVQFSYILYDTSINDILTLSDSIVRLEDCINIPEDSTKIHKITNEISRKCGIDIKFILKNFFYHLKNCDLLVGHNISFDINMVKIEILRMIFNNSSNLSEDEIRDYKYNLHVLTNYKNIYCTLKESIKICDIKQLDKNGKSYLKYPKLVELHEKLFKTTPINLHNSLNDVIVTLRCFIKLNYGVDLYKTCDKLSERAENVIKLL